MAVPKRKSDDATSESVLKDLGLWEQSDTLSWGARTGKNGTYTFVDLKQIGQSDDVTLTLDKLTLTGLHKVDGAGNFDRMDFDGLSVDQSDGQVSIKSATISCPSPELAAEILSILGDFSKVEDLNDLNINIEDEDGFSLGAAYLEDFKITSPENQIALAELNYGEHEKTGKVSFEANTLRVKGMAENDIPLSISLDKALIHGLEQNMSGPTSPAKGDWASNLSGGSFDQMLFENLDFNFDTLSLTSKGLQADSKTKGAITQMSQVMKPVTIKVGVDAKTPQISALSDTLTGLGYDTLVFKGQQSTEVNKETDTTRVFDSFFELEDGFTLNLDYDMSGVNKLQAMMESGAADSASAQQDVLNALKINAAAMSLTDNSIMDRVFKLVAEKQGMSEGVIKMQAKSVLMLASLGARSKEDGKVISSVAGAIGDFIDDGGTLDIVMDPQAPLSIGAMQGLQSGQMPLSDLGLTASVRKP